ncbi:MAG: serine/threonine-protein kinase PknK [Kofleriaceae bacterium]
MIASEGGLGRRIGDRYHIVRELGRGGMGVVYLGRDLRREMDVAIKFRNHVHHEATVWLKREFRTVASLRHPNLVELYELVAHDRSCYFTMEYLPGIDPRRWVERDNQPILPTSISEESTLTALPVAEAETELSLTTRPPSVAPALGAAPVIDFDRLRIVLAQLAEGLAFLHARGVIHRDVKPSNAMVVSGGRVKLLDFGLALEWRRAEEELSREVRLVGTASYLAPEYVERLVVSPAMDIYALGVVASELVTGSPPIGGIVHALSRARRPSAFPRLREVNRECPEDLDEVIGAMLDRDPSRRPTAQQVAVRLTGNLSHPRFVRRDPQFVGRSAELANIAAQIGGPSPHARLVLVTGPSGVGKTAILDEALRRARSSGTALWYGRCHERERVPYRAFDLIVDDLAAELAGSRLGASIDHAAALVRVFPALAGAIRASDTPPASDLRVERDRALHAMTQLLGSMLGRGRGAIFIDDLQWADDDSLELLALLIERVQRPLAVVAAWTLESDGALPGLADRMLPERLRALLLRLTSSVTTIDVTMMGEGELAEVIADLAPNVPTTRLLEAARLAAGSPYLAELIGCELADTDVVDPTNAELRRLDRLTTRERAVAEVTAIAGAAATFEQLQVLAGVGSAELHSVLRGLTNERIVRPVPSASGDPVYTLYHQRLRHVTHATMTDAHRRETHVRFAAWWEANGAAPDQLAYHWREAGDVAAASRWAIAAGDAACSQLAWNLAVDWYGRALEALPDDTVRAKRAEAMFLAGKLAAAAGEFEQLATRANGDRWNVRAAEAYIKLGELERGLALLDTVLARRGRPRTRARAVSALRAVGLASRWLVPVPRRQQPVDEVLAAAYRVIASFLSTPYPIESFEYVLRGIALAERAGDRAAHSMGMAMLAAYLAAGSLGRFGDRAIARARRLSSESGAPYPRMVAAGAEGIVATLRGQWAVMRTAHEEGESICRRLGLELSWEASFLRTYWALGEYYAGEPERALVMLGELASASDDLISRAMLGSYRGRALVLAGDLAAARATLRELEATPAAHRGLASIYRQVFAGELALAEHDWARAIEIGQQLSRTARSQWLSAMPAISAMIDVLIATAEIGLGDRSAATRALGRAHTLQRRGRSSFYSATALRLWGQAEQRLGRDDRARRLFERAASVAAQRGGKLDQLAIAALSGDAIEPGPLTAAVHWSTGGVV